MTEQRPGQYWEWNWNAEIPHDSLPVRLIDFLFNAWWVELIPTGTKYWVGPHTLVRQLTEMEVLALMSAWETERDVSAGDCDRSFSGK